MEAWIKIIIGLVLLLLSFAYLYRPAWVLKLNALGRTLFFNDAHVLHFRRRWGLPIFAAAALFLFTGFNNLTQVSLVRRWSYGWLTGPSFPTRYRPAIVQCEGILAQDPENAQAWSLLGSAWSALGNQDKAKKAWNRSLALNQTDPEGRPTPPSRRR